MKTEVKVFPRNFRSSSAAYRAIRQYEKKMGLTVLGSGLVMTKIDTKNFIVSLSIKITLDELIEKHPNMSYSDAIYRYFPDGVKGEGYYELKIGNRRRPNSNRISVENVYTDLIAENCKL